MSSDGSQRSDPVADAYADRLRAFEVMAKPILENLKTQVQPVLAEAAKPEKTPEQRKEAYAQASRAFRAAYSTLNTEVEKARGIAAPMNLIDFQVALLLHAQDRCADLRRIADALDAGDLASVRRIVEEMGPKDDKARVERARLLRKAGYDEAAWEREKRLVRATEPAPMESPAATPSPAPTLVPS